MTDRQALVAACQIRDKLVEMVGAKTLSIARRVVYMISDRVLNFQRKVIDTVKTSPQARSWH